MADEFSMLSPAFDWEAAEDLTDMTEPELRKLLARVSEEARVAEYRHEVLRGRAALVRAELAGRGLGSLTAEELAKVLMGEQGRSL